MTLKSLEALCTPKHCNACVIVYGFMFICNKKKLSLFLLLEGQTDTDLDTLKAEAEAEVDTMLSEFLGDKEVRCLRIDPPPSLL